MLTWLSLKSYRLACKSVCRTCSHLPLAPMSFYKIIIGSNSWEVSESHLFVCLFIYIFEKGTMWLCLCRPDVSDSIDLPALSPRC